MDDATACQQRRAFSPRRIVRDHYLIKLFVSLSAGQCWPVDSGHGYHACTHACRVGQMGEVRQIRGVSWAAEEVTSHFFCNAPDVRFSLRGAKVGKVGKVGIWGCAYGLEKKLVTLYLSTPLNKSDSSSSSAGHHAPQMPATTPAEWGSLKCLTCLTGCVLEKKKLNTPLNKSDSSSSSSGYHAPNMSRHAFASVTVRKHRWALCELCQQPCRLHRAGLTGTLTAFCLLPTSLSPSATPPACRAARW